MKVTSIWQPYASLAALGIKTIETKIWPAPKSLIGQRLGIAATKNIKAEQRMFFADNAFQVFYARLGLPKELDELPRGCLLGTAILDSCEAVTPGLLESISAEEQRYGWYHVPERTVFAWRLRDPRPFLHPVPFVGVQGLGEWNGELGDDYQVRAPSLLSSMSETSSGQAAGGDQAGQIADRRHLRLV